MSKPNFLIIGWGRSGKDECAGFMNDHLGLPYAGSTSWAALPLMAERLKTHPQLAWEQRHANRQFWKDCCDEFRRKDECLLVRLALSKPILPAYSSIDGTCLGGCQFGRVVTGVRDAKEIHAMKKEGIFERIVWIDRPGVPVDPTVTYSSAEATDFIKNDGDLRQFHRNIVRWAVSSQIEITPSTYATELLLDPVQ